MSEREAHSMSMIIQISEGVYERHEKKIIILRRRIIPLHGHK